MHIGFGKTDITPKLGVELSGYGYYLDRRAAAILDPLYARAVALKDDERTLLVVNCDLIGLPSSMVEAIKSAWQKEFGLDSQDALLLSIHTHSGPATGVLRGCGELDAQYASDLTKRIIGAGREALGNLVAVTGISSFKGTASGIAWNRVFDEQGPVDDGVYGLIFEREGLRPLSLVSFACHPVTLGRNEEVSADYPGRVVQHLDEMGYESIFLCGCSGDIDPAINARSWGTGTEATIDDYGRRIAEAATEAMKKAEPMQNVTLDSFELAVELPLQPLTEDVIRKEMEEAEAAREEDPAYARVIEEWVRAMESQKQGTETATIQVLRIGKTILVGFPGETFTKLGLIIKEALPGWQVMTLGNANWVMRYIPVKEDIEAKNYAAYDSCRVYDRLPLQPGAGEHLAETALAAIKECFAIEQRQR
ncbi:MAG: hypothetical protein GX322_04860 [Firmicutes bacterium]|nr:hypothetical protein [Bacillota bacterium]